ncbi:MAG: PIN domain-containing protein [Candidatus Thermoplasmatota archaeon]
MTRAVVFDTNALLLPFANGTKLEDEILTLLGATEWLVPSSVMVELKTLAHKGEGATMRHAKMAVKYAERCKVVTTKLAGDDGLLDVARSHKAAVVTNDKTLQEECVRSGLTVIVARENGRRLAIKGAAAGPF